MFSGPRSIFFNFNMSPVFFPNFIDNSSPLLGPPGCKSSQADAHLINCKISGICNFYVCLFFLFFLPIFAALSWLPIRVANLYYYCTTLSRLLMASAGLQASSQPLPALFIYLFQRFLVFNFYCLPAVGYCLISFSSTAQF